METNGVTCSDVEGQDVAARYVAGTLDLDAVERFETHVLVCARCQQSVELAATVRRAARATGEARAAATAGRHDAPPPRGSPVGRRLRFRRRALSVSSALLAAGIGTVLLLRWRNAQALRALGVPEGPPRYGGVPVRGPADRSDSLFAAAMQAYVRGDYGAAAAGLRPLASDSAAPPTPIFYLASALLMSHQATGAESAFARVVAMGGSPYQREALYYGALARLQLRDRAGAIRDLTGVAQAPDWLGVRAGALLRRLSRGGEVARSR